MTREEKRALVEQRLKKLKESPKNIKCPGTVKKLERELRHLS